MKKLVNALLLLNFSLLQAGGFDSDTLVTMACGRLKPIKELRVGDEVVCYNSNLQPETNQVKAVHSFMVDSSMLITTQNNIILTCALTERFYLPKESQWVFAKDLKEGDCLLNEDLEVVAITNIKHQIGQKVMFAITVDNIHNFIASEGKFIVHNGTGGATVGFWATKFIVYTIGHGTIAAISGGVGLVSGPAGYVVAQALESTFAGPIEYVSNVVALAGGVSLAVATGPV